MFGPLDTATGILMGMYGNFPGRDSLLERGFTGNGSLTGGPRTPQRFYGAEAAGRIGTPLGRGSGRVDRFGRPIFDDDDQQAQWGGMPGGGTFNGPTSSEFGALNRSYKTRGDAPRYHEEMPLGGTPGVWAIRNDEIGGPVQDQRWELGQHGMRPWWSRRR